MSQSTLDSFSSTETQPPYPIPLPDSKSEMVARSIHRRWYWDVHDDPDYECPDCDMTRSRHKREMGRDFDVHHKDENPRNGAPSNLVGLCRRCHRRRHGKGETISNLRLEEWKEEMLAHGAGNGVDMPRGRQ